MHLSRTVLATFLLVGSASVPAGDRAYRVKDIRTTEGSDHVSTGCMTEAGGVAYFYAETPQSGGEVWVTDGTAEGTHLLVDVDPINMVVYAEYCPALMPPPIYNGQLYFISLGGDETGGLWVSDGTPAGTIRLARNAYPRADVDGTLFFKNEGELWKTDGTEAGTGLVKDIGPGAASSYGDGFVDVDGQLLFFADDGANGMEPWRSDGTEAGTTLVRDINPGIDASSSLPNPVVLDGFAYFTALDGEGAELWKSDGTEANTTRVVDIAPGPASSGPRGLIAGEQHVFFGADDGGGRDLWRTDGTPAGTIQLRSGVYPQADENNHLEYTTLGAAVFFKYSGAIWRSDGTPEGTVGVFFGAGYYDTELTAANGKVYFANSAGLHEIDGDTVSVVPGTENAYVRGLSAAFGLLHFSVDDRWLRRLEPGGEIADLLGPPPGSSSPATLTPFGDAVLFSADDEEHGTELWRSDGTAAGTEVFDLNPGAESSAPSTFIEFDGALLFTATDGVHGFELWRTDGTATGTALVRDISPGSYSSSMRYPFVIGTTLYFSAHDPTHGRELWKSDGTEAGTMIVADIRPGAVSSFPVSFHEWNGTLFFVATTDVGRELWRSDGTAEGTVMVEDIRWDTGHGDPYGFSNNGDYFFMVANDGFAGRELWRSDGTAEGTYLVKDVWAGSSSGSPDFLSIWGDLLYFSARTGAGGGFWRSDGTTSGTYRVKSIPSGTEPPYVSAPVPFDDSLFFVVNWRDDPCCSDYFSRELWKTDGTTAGTGLVKDVRPGGENDNVAPDDSLVTLGERLLFSANDGETGSEPWISDGTASGTTRLADLSGGAIGSLPRSIVTTPDGTTALFRARELESGYELWTTDGTAGGTSMVQDIAPGVAPSVKEDPEMTVALNQVFFVANDSASGLELWALPTEAPGAVPDGGAFFDGVPLRLERVGAGEVRLSWAAAVCGPEATDYAAYEGLLGEFAGHAAIACSTGGAVQLDVEPAEGDRYYIVVPQSQNLEGSYGKQSDGRERAAASAACRPRVVYDSCP